MNPLKHSFRSIIPATRRWSVVAAWAVLLTLFVANFQYKFWKEDKRIIMGDVVSYYQYLPALFVHHDVSMQFTRENPSFYKDHFWVHRTEKGGLVGRMPLGMSALYAPFFLIAHAVAEPLGYRPDGFSAPYKFALVISCLFFVFFGLWFLRKALLTYFSEKETAITLLIIGLATNLFFYAVIEPPMSHAYSFSLVALLIWLVIRWYATGSWRHAILIGMVAGVILLVRPFNLLLLLLVFLWGIGTWDDLRNRLRFFLNRWPKLLVMALFALLVLSPQFIYWEITTGQFLFYSYDQERFFFDQPHIIKGMFGYRNGWLVYTPVMVFSLAGMILAFRKHRQLILPVAPVWLINVYLIFSWWCWWYASAFGLRAMIDSYALLAFPLTAFTAWIFRKHILIRTIYLTLIAFFIFLNIFQTHQYYKGAIHWGSMTREAYWDSFLRTEPSDRFKSLLKHPDYQLAKKGLVGFTETDVVNAPRTEPVDTTGMAEFIRQAHNVIRNDTAWYRKMLEKADITGISVDSVIYKDAKWLWEKKQEKKDHSPLQ